MKNCNGTGCVIKLPGKRRKPYAAVITSGWIQIFDDNGLPQGNPKQQRQYIGYYTSRKEAQKALYNYNDQIPEETRITPKTASKQPFVPTFAQLFREVKAIRGTQWSGSTERNYKQCFKRCEKLHDKRVDTITYADLQKEMNAFMAEGKTAGNLRLYKVFFSLCFGEAEKLGYIASSPAKYVTYKATAEKQVKHVIPDAVLLNVLRSQCFTKEAVLILCYTGMRINELLDLKEENVHDGYLIAGSKTECGKNRSIPIHPFIAPMIKTWFDKPRKAYNTYSLRLKEDCEEYGMQFTFHECRHTFITNANKYGIDLYCLKRIVGHATTDVTEGVYTHIQMDTLQREINKIPSLYATRMLPS